MFKQSSAEPVEQLTSRKIGSEEAGDARRAIVRAMDVLFRNKAGAFLTIEEVARLAGLDRSDTYHHFGSLDRLIPVTRSDKEPRNTSRLGRHIVVRCDR